MSAFLDTDWTDIDFEEPKKVAKGQCPKCGKHIGKGIAFHIKACKGHDDTRGA